MKKSSMVQLVLLSALLVSCYDNRRREEERNRVNESYPRTTHGYIPLMTGSSSSSSGFHESNYSTGRTTGHPTSISTRGGFGSSAHISSAS